MSPDARPLAAALLLVLGCGPAAPPSPPAPVESSPVAALPAQIAPRRAYEAVVIEGVPHVRQEPDFCGEACVEMALRKLGRPLSQDEVFNRSGLDPALGRGVNTAELKTALEQIGFFPGPVWIPIDAAHAAEGLEAEFEAMHADLQKGIPSIVCMHYSDRPDTTEHFRLILGYDAATDEVIYNEPAEDHGAYRRMSRSLFEKLWPLKYNASTWTAIRFRLQPGALSTAVTARAGFSPAEYAQHVLALRARIGNAFALRIEPPFVVIGDLSPGSLRGHAENTVRWAASRLKDDYFDHDPDKILDVWLFKDASSYERNVLSLFGEKPSTPYGYYSPAHAGLIMNIATGGGTLVHEIVHPYMEANFPGCPPWFNEGLGSLYEQSGEERGHIRGYPNWRLPGLQRAIKAGQVPSFKALTSADAHAFYDEDRGTNYGQARYLCYYLQEEGLLVKFYREFHAHSAEDPTGYATLQRVLREDDMDRFKRRWEAFVMTLSFP